MLSQLHFLLAKLIDFVEHAAITPTHKGTDENLSNFQNYLSVDVYSFETLTAGSMNPMRTLL